MAGRWTRPGGAWHENRKLRYNVDPATKCFIFSRKVIACAGECRNLPEVSALRPAFLEQNMFGASGMCQLIIAEPARGMILWQRAAFRSDAFVKH